MTAAPETARAALGGITVAPWGTDYGGEYRFGLSALAPAPPVADPQNAFSHGPAQHPRPDQQLSGPSGSRPEPYPQETVMLQRMTSAALGMVLAAAGVFGAAATASAEGGEVAAGDCTTGSICFWSEPGFHGEKTVYKSALVECTRIVKPSSDAPERLMTARSVRNRTDRTIVIGYRDPSCLVPASLTSANTPLHLSALADNPDLGDGIRYIRTT